MSEATGKNQRMSRRILGQLRPFWRQIGSTGGSCATAGSAEAWEVAFGSGDGAFGGGAAPAARSSAPIVAAMAAASGSFMLWTMVSSSVRLDDHCSGPPLLSVVPFTHQG